MHFPCTWRTCRNRSVLVMIPRNRPDPSTTTALPARVLSAILFLILCMGADGQTRVTCRQGRRRWQQRQPCHTHIVGIRKATANADEYRQCASHLHPTRICRIALPLHEPYTLIPKRRLAPNPEKNKNHHERARTPLLHPKSERGFFSHLGQHEARHRSIRSALLVFLSVRLFGRRLVDRVCRTQVEDAPSCACPWHADMSSKR